MPTTGSPGLTLAAVATGIAARGHSKMRKKRRMPMPKGSCLVERAFPAMFSSLLGWKVPKILNGGVVCLVLLQVYTQ
jgi:hypothetical protein